MRHQREALIAATLGPILLFVWNFYGCVFPLLRYFPRHPYSHDDVVECEQDFVGTVGKPKFEQFRRSSSGPIALPLAIDLRAFFLSYSQPAGLHVTGLSAFAIGPR